MPRAVFLFDFVLSENGKKVYKIEKSPIIVPDPEMPVSRVKEVVGKSFDEDNLFEG